MRTITRVWEPWRAVIAVLHTKAVPDRLEHPDRLQQQHDQPPPGQAPVTLHLPCDVFLHSSTLGR